jgi:hypothetical protein
MHVIESRPNFDVSEERHPEDGEDEHDEKEQQTDVDQGGKGHDERKEQCSNALRALDQTKDSADLRYSHHSKQCRRDKVLFDKVT